MMAETINFLVEIGEIAIQILLSLVLHKRIVKLLQLTVLWWHKLKSCHGLVICIRLPSSEVDNSSDEASYPVVSVKCVDWTTEEAPYAVVTSMTFSSSIKPNVAIFDRDNLFTTQDSLITQPGLWPVWPLLCPVSSLTGQVVMAIGNSSLTG